MIAAFQPTSERSIRHVRVDTLWPVMDMEASDGCAAVGAETFTGDGGGPNMTFDYELRASLATSTNALALMELLGFDVTEEFSVSERT